ncbi:hypothetical protein LR48_Vigan03g258300 [Vigna angularis]|uniref:Uncharacterized protein n=1 Tax=Phaseolus angularis TaxID=3914 RepID=A0A0L9U911_PHAAN|nr:hypothetical protein LR48_Vigan03g258300 [Vigna angularis]
MCQGRISENQIVEDRYEQLSGRSALTLLLLSKDSHRFFFRSSLKHHFHSSGVKGFRLNRSVCEAELVSSPLHSAVRFPGRATSDHHSGTISTLPVSRAFD